MLLAERTFTSYDVCKYARVTYRQLDYWTRCGRITPMTVKQHTSRLMDTGSGVWRRWTYEDIFIVAVIGRLRDAHVDFPVIDNIIVSIRDAPERDYVEALTNNDAIGLTLNLRLIRNELDKAIAS